MDSNMNSSTHGEAQAGSGTGATTGTGAGGGGAGTSAFRPSDEGTFLYITSLNEHADSSGEKGEDGGDSGGGGEQSNSLVVVQRLLSEHPVQAGASIETVLVSWKDPDGGKWLRVTVKDGPDAAVAAAAAGMAYPGFGGFGGELFGAASSSSAAAPAASSSTSFHASYQLPPDAVPPDTGGQVMCWTAFPEYPNHKVLCVLVHRMAVCIYDVYPDSNQMAASVLSRQHRRVSTVAGGGQGWSVKLPFDCSAIHPLGQSRGLLLQRIPDAQKEEEEEEELQRQLQLQQQEQEKQEIHSLRSDTTSKREREDDESTVASLLRSGRRRGKKLPFDDESELSKYEDHPLVKSMIRYQRTRNAELLEEGKRQMLCPKSADGWIKSLFILQARALDWIYLPWSIVMLHATAYTVVQEEYWPFLKDRDTSSWEIFFGLVLNWTLSYLLVFRLNRSALRYWTSRFYWGTFIEKGRTLVGGIIVHSEHDAVNRYEAIRWVAALSISTMEYLRGIHEMPTKAFAGILTKQEIKNIEANSHSALYVADQVRGYLKEIFRVTPDTPVSLSHAYTIHYDTLEVQLNQMLDACGMMERIKTTPLPITFVSHLRTFLMLALLLLPYVWGPAWGWSTIPFVALTSFALLGIEAASAEVESPFHRDRANSLNMDGFCEGFLSNIQQQIRNYADMEIKEKRAQRCRT